VALTIEPLVLGKAGATCEARRWECLLAPTAAVCLAELQQASDVL